MILPHDGSPMTALRRAMPYVRLYRNQIFVIKAGGAVFESCERTRALMEQIGILHDLSIRLVLVHGGGPQTTRVAEQLGIETQMVEGRRVTSERILDVTTMVLNGSVNTRILAQSRKLGIPAVGVSGVDSGLVHARRRPPQTIDGTEVDYGLVGDVVKVHPALLLELLANGHVPVVSPLCCDQNGVVLNLNADVMAAHLSVALKARKTVFLTGAPGILDRSGQEEQLLSIVDLIDLESLRRNGSLDGGMLPKASAITLAVEGGVPKVHVISHDQHDSLLIEIFTNEGCGTMVVREKKSLAPDEQPAASGT